MILQGKKEIEEFYTGYEKLDLKRFETIGIIENAPIFENKLDELVRESNI